MKKGNNISKVIILTIILIIITSLYIIIVGNTYTLRLENDKDIQSVENIIIKIEQDKKVVECTEKKIHNGKLILKFKSINEGYAFIDINYPGEAVDRMIGKMYVHKLGTITFDNFLGDVTGGILVPISIFIIIVYSLYLLIKTFKIEMKKNLYQYKNIFYLGLIIFLSFCLIKQIFIIMNYNGIINTIKKITGVYANFSFFLLPTAFIVSIFATISNIILIKKEGKNWKNLLGLILGIFVCFMTIVPSLLGDYLQTVTWVDVHYEQGIAIHLENFVETAISSVVSYLECILLATIILSVKAAKHIPKYDKDYIIILGCMIKKDGSLTNLLKSRVDKAIEFRNKQKSITGKDLIFIPSGGKGNDEIISESLAMKNYLLKQGIKDKNILLEDKSTNTYENIKYSNKIIKEKTQNANVAFSTTNYHVFRAGTIAAKQNITIEGIGSKTKTYFWLNAFIREFIATLYSEKKEHIKMILLIIILNVLIITLVYISNIM